MAKGKAPPAPAHMSNTATSGSKMLQHVDVLLYETVPPKRLQDDTTRIHSGKWEMIVSAFIKG